MWGASKPTKMKQARTERRGAQISVFVRSLFDVSFFFLFVFLPRSLSLLLRSKRAPFWSRKGPALLVYRFLKYEKNKLGTRSSTRKIRRQQQSKGCPTPPPPPSLSLKAKICTTRGTGDRPPKIQIRSKIFTSCCRACINRYTFPALHPTAGASRRSRSFLPTSNHLSTYLPNTNGKK